MTTTDIAGLCALLKSRCAAIDAHYARFPNTLDRTKEDTAKAIRAVLDTLERQAAEIERLRGALENIATVEVNEFRVGPVGAPNIQLDGEEWFCLSRDVRSVLEVARAALTGEDA